jgi:LuxR family maltose regulon positive regulatory protein
MTTNAAPRHAVRADPVERPRLFALLDQGSLGPVTLLCAPAGSGKTMLLSSWLGRGDPPGLVAWVAVERGESDPTRFWGAVIDALRGSGAVGPGSALSTLLPSPAGSHDEFLDRLPGELGRLREPLLLVIDDLHELRSDEALRGLERLLARAPASLRTILVSRREPKLGLHRLRLSGHLTEIRAADLEFTPEESGELMQAAGVVVSAGELATLHARTEGWAAGLRLAAMALTRHAAPDRFVVEFAGSERTVADYLLEEVLESLPSAVRRLLLRTCILERVNGALADLLTGRSDGTRMLHELEEANAMVVAVDVGRSWFRYHHLLADLLRLELRREAPDEIAGLHRLAAAWHAERGHAVEAIRHAELGGDWPLAGELLGRDWVHLLLDGEEATLGRLLADLPADRIRADAELATIAAADLLARSRWTEADALIAAARTALPELPAERRHRAETALATVTLLRARRVGDLGAAVDEASALLHGEGAPAGAELEALALMNLGIAEGWTLRLAESEAHLERALALGRRLERPYIEIGCLGALGTVANLSRRLDLAERHTREAVAIAERLGWSTLPIVAVADLNLAAVLIDRGRLDEGERWLQRADPILADAPEPAARVGLRYSQGTLAMARGQHAAALAVFDECERLAEQLRAPHFLETVARQWQLRAQLRLGDAEPARAALASAGPEITEAQWCNLAAHVQLVADEPAGAVAAVEPVLAGRAFAFHTNQVIEALLIDALARTTIGEREAAERSIERALDLAEPQGHVWIWLTVAGARKLLAEHPPHRTAHAAYLRALLDHLDGAGPARVDPEALADPLNERELTVLRFLPTNLSAPEIGAEMFLSVNTVKTHMRKLYAKLDVHTRAEAVERGRALGLLAPSRRA